MVVWVEWGVRLAPLCIYAACIAATRPGLLSFLLLRERIDHVRANLGDSSTAGPKTSWATLRPGRDSWHAGVWICGEAWEEGRA